ncbi:MAG: thioredoxin family protein [Thiohalocapsa sp.]|nr:thioredoxin family protein [Thiohalocapsa sp.]
MPRGAPGQRARAVLLLLGLLLLAAPPAPSWSAASRVTTEHVTARLVTERSVVAPGESVDAALVLDLRPGWHTYWRNPGDSGEPPRIDWRLPAGVEAGPIRWPLPERIPVGPLANYGYSGRAIHLVELRVADDWPVGEPIAVVAEAYWLVCEEACIPEQSRFALRLDTAARSGPADAAVADVFGAARAALPLPGSVAASFSRDGGLLRLEVPVAALRARLSLPEDFQIADVAFFSDAWGLIEHAAEQRWHARDERLVVDLVPGAAPPDVEPAGLLVIETPDGPRGVHVDAGASAGAAPALDPEAFDTASLGLPGALLLALLGGLVLNLMPCVFPVLAIKALGFARQGGAPLRERALHGIAYTAGVLTFFAVVAALLLALRGAGFAVGWGFQLQSPLFVALMAYLFLLLGLSLAGAVTIGTGLMGIGGGLETGRGHAGAFATGGLAALVAAPCTAPFMGAALGYAVTLPWLPALTIVLALGVGMALPFLLLTLVPGLAGRLPRPGPWMERLKQLLAFPMFATAAWLVWVLSVQVGSDGVAAVLAGMLLLALSLWALEQTRHASSAVRRGVGALAVLGIGTALWLGAATERQTAPRHDALAGEMPPASHTGLSGVAYSADVLSGALAAGRPVFVNMTAAWCITCLVNERVALSSARVARAFVRRDVLYLKGDWTNRDPDITRYLSGFGRNGVPIYVFYPPGRQPEVLPQLLTESLVLATLGDDT